MLKREAPQEAQGQCETPRLESRPGFHTVRAMVSTHIGKWKKSEGLPPPSLRRAEALRLIWRHSIRSAPRMQPDVCVPAATAVTAAVLRETATRLLAPQTKSFARRHAALRCLPSRRHFASRSEPTVEVSLRARVRQGRGEVAGQVSHRVTRGGAPPKVRVGVGLRLRFARPLFAQEGSPPRVPTSAKLRRPP